MPGRSRWAVTDSSRRNERITFRSPDPSVIAVAFDGWRRQAGGGRSSGGGLGDDAQRALPMELDQRLAPPALGGVPFADDDLTRDDPAVGGSTRQLTLLGQHGEPRDH